MVLSFLTLPTLNPGDTSVRFDPSGPNIPSELIAAQERGEVVFVCGAGVSMTVGLPSFRELVEKIYTDVGDSWTGHVAEVEGMAANAYDRVIRCLERRLGGDDGKLVQRVRERIRIAVRKGLVPLEGDLSAHFDILRLSCDAELRNRLVTTNFDTLFERAWIAKNGAANSIKSHAGASMPGPLAAGFAGVLHLHGRIIDQDLHLEESDLVLTSAEFGEAYLRSGWATRYVYDLVRATTVVIVGYTADDPPMRYLLEAIDADRERFKDLRAVYAFVPHKPGEGARQCELWKSKGAIPIPYEIPTEKDHVRLYASLGLWAQYGDDPTMWRRDRLATLLAISPDVATNAQLEEVTWLLSHADAATNLGNANPSPDWLRKFTELKALGDDPMVLWPWVTKNLTSLDMIQACADCESIQPRFFKALGFDLSRHSDKIDKLLVTAWYVLIRTRSKEAGAWMNSVFESKRRLKAGDVGYGTIQLVREALRPLASARRPFHYGDKIDPKPPTSVDGVLTIDFHSEIERAGQPELMALVAAIPKDNDLEFTIIDSLSRMLLDSLDDAADSGFLSSGYDRTSQQVPSVAAHGQNQYSRGFYPLVRVIADLWDRAAPNDKARGKKFAVWCLEQRYTLLKRLGVHCLTSKDVFDGDEAGQALMALPDVLFWKRARREQMRLLAERWNDFPQQIRDALEDRLLAGPPDNLIGG